MAGDDKERDRGHAHRSNGSKPVQAASAELARQGTEACAVYSGLQRAFWYSHRFGYAAALCSTVAEFWRPDCAEHSMRGDPGVWRIWPSENQHWREGAEQRIDPGIYPTVFCSVSQNLAILWLLSWLRPLWLNPRKGQREAQRQIRRFA